MKGNKFMNDEQLATINSIIEDLEQLKLAVKKLEELINTK